MVDTVLLRRYAKRGWAGRCSGGSGGTLLNRKQLLAAHNCEVSHVIDSCVAALSANLVNLRCPKLSSSHGGTDNVRITCGDSLANRRRKTLNPKGIVLLCSVSKPFRPSLASSLRLLCVYPTPGLQKRS